MKSPLRDEDKIDNSLRLLGIVTLWSDTYGIFKHGKENDKSQDKHKHDDSRVSIQNHRWKSILHS